MMGSWKKTILIGVGGLAVVIVALVIAVYLLVTPERIKGWALPVLEENLHRQVTLGDVEIGLFSGITLNDLQIRALDGEHHLVAVESLLLSYQFKPLLQGRLVIDEVRLTAPQVRLVQFADGRLSIDDLLSSSAEEKVVAPAEEPVESDDAAGIDLLVSRVVLENGTIEFLNQSEGAPDLILSAIDLLVRDITLDGSIPFTLDVRFAQTDFRFDGEFAPSTSQGRVNLSVERLDLNTVLAHFAPESALETTESSESEQTGSDPEPVEPGPVDIPVQIAGAVQIGELLYEDLVVSAMRADYRLQDNHFNLDLLKGQVAGGGFEVRSAVDLNKPGFAYRGDIDLQGIDLGGLASALVPEVKDAVQGTLRGSIDFSGAGALTATLLDNLRSRGDIRLENGRLRGGSFLGEMSSFLGQPELRVLSFKSLGGTFDLQSRIAQLDIALDSSRTRIKAQGTAAIDGALKLTLETALAPDVLKGVSLNSPFGRALSDENGWGVLPMKVAGTYSAPSFKLDSSKLKDQVKDEVKAKVKKKVEEKISEKIQEKLGTEEIPAQELIDKSLKKLFGR